MVDSSSKTLSTAACSRGGDGLGSTRGARGLQEMPPVTNRSGSFYKPLRRCSISSAYALYMRFL